MVKVFRRKPTEVRLEQYWPPGHKERKHPPGEFPRVTEVFSGAQSPEPGVLISAFVITASGAKVELSLEGGQWIAPEKAAGLAYPIEEERLKENYFEIELDPADRFPRELTLHKVNECNEKLKIRVVDEPGSGGANHRYDISGFDKSSNPSAESILDSEANQTIILFQNGPIKEAGVNGITHEALLAILVDRLEGFQKGPYACDENQEALENVCAAMAVLKSRTLKREARGVEGTHAV